MQSYNEIEPNKCPYCKNNYGIEWGGCEIHCAPAEKVKQMIKDAIEADDLSLGEV